MGTRWQLRLLLGAGEGAGRAWRASAVGQRRFLLAAQHYGVAVGARGEAGRFGLQIGGARGTVQSLLQNCECRFVIPVEGHPPRSLRSQGCAGAGEGQNKPPGQRMWVPGKDHPLLAQPLRAWRELGCPNPGCGAPQTPRLGRGAGGGGRRARLRWFLPRAVAEVMAEGVRSAPRAFAVGQSVRAGTVLASSGSRRAVRAALCPPPPSSSRSCGEHHSRFFFSSQARKQNSCCEIM